MKLFRHIAFSALLTVGAFSAITYTACNKDACSGVTCNNGGTCSGGNCTCPTGVAGTHCDTLLKVTYSNSYKGNGYDNATPSNSYTGWTLKFGTTSSTDPTAMTLDVLDNNNVPQLAFTIHLTSNTAFTVDAKTSSSFNYSGSGTISASIASLTLTEAATSGVSTTVYTFNNMIKQ